tara:strand:+ start:682 stop:861 length:180 start_codon:yes stop_codon:yes gene_type:complete
MKVTIEIEGKPEEFQEVFVPSEKQTEFMNMTYDAYCEALRTFIWDNIDPHKFIRGKNDK